MSDTLPTATRVSDAGIRALYRLENRWQAFELPARQLLAQDDETALAQTDEVERVLADVMLIKLTRIGTTLVPRGSRENSRSLEKGVLLGPIDRRASTSYRCPTQDERPQIHKRFAALIPFVCRTLSIQKAG
jgi:hypothetical protein